MTKRSIFLIGVCILVSLSLFFIKGQLFLHDGKLHVVFCDVGQGDGILIKSPQGKIVLVDGGPDESFSRCLSSRLPFWHRAVDLMIVTHPHADHYLGFMPVAQKYEVKKVAFEDLVSEQEAYRLFLSLLRDEQIPRQILSLGDTYRIGGVVFTVVGPSRQLLQRSSPNGTIGESKEFASLILLVTYADTSFLLTGDSQADEVKEAIETFGLSSVTVFQSPHHGSATGLTEPIISTLQPKIGVVSVGKDNRYGHPASSILKLFEQKNVPTMRTDQVGDIHLVSDGEAVTVR